MGSDCQFFANVCPKKSWWQGDNHDTKLYLLLQLGKVTSHWGTFLELIMSLSQLHFSWSGFDCFMVPSHVFILLAKFMKDPETLWAITYLLCITKVLSAVNSTRVRKDLCDCVNKYWEISNMHLTAVEELQFTMSYLQEMSDWSITAQSEHETWKAVPMQIQFKYM